MTVTSQHSPTVLAAAAQGIAARISAAGVDPADVLSEVGLRASDLADPGSPNRPVTVLRGVRSCRTPHHAHSLRPRIRHVVSSTATRVAGATWRSAPQHWAPALRKFAAYLPAHQEATRLALRGAAGASAAVEYAILDDSIKHRQQDAELSIAMLFNLFRHCHGSRWTPLGIHLMHTKPTGRTRYEELLGTRPQFSQSSNRIVFRRSGPRVPHAPPGRAAHAFARSRAAEATAPQRRRCAGPRTARDCARARIRLIRPGADLGAMRLAALDTQATAEEAGHDVSCPGRRHAPRARTPASWRAAPPSRKSRPHSATRRSAPSAARSANGPGCRHENSWLRDKERCAESESCRHARHAIHLPSGETRGPTRFPLPSDSRFTPVPSRNTE